MKQNLKRSKKIPELLAPAGNIETFYAVLRAGADAVYLAGNKFGARAYADNFSEDEIISCIHFAHLYGKRIYLTVNTLTRNSEISELLSFLEPLYEAGLDAVIVQDLGVFSVIRNNFPELELHASTQMNITTSEAASLIKNEGACRIVPARELSLGEINKIKEDTGLELECFIHGAMCYCYSGQCLFSSVVGKRSGNRGKCAQPCRLPYSINGKNNIYPLSLKDMCTINILGELIDAGIDSFKIEGRMKKPEYAAGVTAIYRKAIDNYISFNETRITKQDLDLLNSLYIRSEISEGYYNKHNGKDMVTLGSPSYNGATDSVLDKIRNEYIGDNASKKMEKYPIRFFATFIENTKCNITGVCGEFSESVTGELVEKAIGKPILLSDVKKSLGKLGNTCFMIASDQNFDEDIIISEAPYYSLKGINELRREVVAGIEKQIIDAFSLSKKVRPIKQKTLREDCTESDRKTSINIPGEIRSNLINKFVGNFDECLGKKNEFHVRVSTKEQLNTLSKYDGKEINGHIITRVYIPEELLLSNISIPNFKEIDIYIAGPYVRRFRDAECIETIDKLLCAKKDKAEEKEEPCIKGYLAANLEDINRFNQITNVVSDFGVYAWNDFSIALLSKYCLEIGLPIEISEGGQKELYKYSDCSFEKMIYGRLPLMHTANCVAKTTDSCFAKDKEKLHFMELVDRTGRKNPVLVDCVHCQNHIYNSLPLSIYKRIDAIPSNVSFRFDFTNENASEMINVLDYFFNPTGKPDWDYTSGFEKQSAQ